MSNQRSIRKKLKKSVCMVKTGITFEGCQVVLAVDPAEAEEKARRFRVMMNMMNHRSSLVNMRDIMNISLIIRDRLMDGKPIWN